MTHHWTTMESRRARARRFGAALFVATVLAASAGTAAGGATSTARGDAARDDSTLTRVTAPDASEGAAAAAARPLLLDLDEVLAEARAQNPSIAAARARARAAAAVPARVSAYDDPTLSWEAWNAPAGFAIERADNNIVRVAQRIPFPGKRTAAGTVAARDADVAVRQAELAELEVTTAVKRAYYDLWQTHQNQEIYARDRAIVERVARTTADRYAAGEATQPDVLRARVELSHIQNQVTTEALALESARAELNALLSRNPESPLGRPADPAPPAITADPAALATEALRTRPELAAQRAVVAREESAVRAARLDYLPDFEASVGRFVNHDAPDGFGAMLSVSLPLAFKGKYDAALAEAQGRRSEAEAELRRLEDMVRREVQQAFLRARTAAEQHHLYAGLHLPHAEQTLAATESAYAANQVDFLSLLDSIRTIQMTHLEHARAAADFERAYADLERAVGAALPRPAEASNHPDGQGGAGDPRPGGVR